MIKKILRGISGEVGGGKMTAIMGASGSGKTTLINLLSSRSVPGKTIYYDGELMLNNVKVKNMSICKNIIGFVPQEDIIVKEATVQENLEIYSRYRRIENSKERVESVIQMLDLEKCRDTVIGNAFSKGVSGGEGKRVSVGIELVSDPEILFLDEPTTGLDAKTALDTMQCIKNISQQKKMGVVAVIHQPRREILDLFDQVFVLSDGNLIYDGSITGIENKILNLGYDIPQFATGADYLMELIDRHKIQTSLAKDFELEESDIIPLADLVLKNRIKALKKAEKTNMLRKRSTILGKTELRQSILSNSIKSEVILNKSSKLGKTSLKKKELPEVNLEESLIPDFYSDILENTPSFLSRKARSKNTKAGFCEQFWIILYYNLKFYVRNTTNLMTMCAQQIITLGLIYLIFRKLGDPKDDTLVAIQNRIGFSALMTAYGFFSGFWSDIIVFIQKRKLFLRDQDGCYYDALPYFLANQLYTVPFYALIIFITSTGYFFLFPLNDYPHVAPNWLSFYFFVYFGGFFSGASLGGVIAGLSEKVEMITAVMAFIIPPITIATGFNCNLKSSTIFIQIFSYFSPTRFTYQGILVNEFQNREDYVDTCYSYYPCIDDPSKKCKYKVPTKNQNTCDPVLVNDFVQTTVLENILFILGLCVFYKILGYVIFRIKCRKKLAVNKPLPKTRLRLPSRNTN